MENRVDNIPLTSLRQFFGRMTENTFRELRIWDRGIIDYVAGMLARFARTDNLYKIKTLEGKKLHTVVEMLLESELTGENFNPQREKDIRQHIGDYTLFMTGIFREYVERRAIFGYYIQEGKKSYLSASELSRMLFQTGALLFEDLSKDFEYISGALNYMKKVYFYSEQHTGPYSEILRQLNVW